MCSCQKEEKLYMYVFYYMCSCCVFVLIAPPDGTCQMEHLPNTFFFFKFGNEPNIWKREFFFPSDWSNWRELLSATFKAGQPDFIQALQFHCSPHSVSARKKVGDRLGKSLRLLNVFAFLQFT